MSADTIREQALRELTAAGTSMRICMVGRSGGFALEVRCENYSRQLATSRGALRLFSLPTATSYIRSLGLTTFEVDAAKYLPGRIRKPRPDRAAALRGTRTRLRQAPLL